jgi:hypothetical protein
MTRTTHSPLDTYGGTRSVERLVDAVETVRGTIMREVADREARSQALALMSRALGVACQGVG